MNLFRQIKGWLSGLFAKKDIEDALKIKIATSPAMQEAQELWRKVYAGFAPWNDKCTPSLFLAAGLCVEFARSVTVELKSEIRSSAGPNPVEETGTRAAYLQEQYNTVLASLRKAVEDACAGGTIVLRPFVRGGAILVDAVENDCFFPIRYNELKELERVIFLSTIVKREKFFTLLEDCDYSNGNYTITYSAYVSDNKRNLGRPCPVNDVEEWAALPPSITFNDVKQPWFVMLTMPQKNHIDKTSPEGVSIFSKAIEHLRRADKQSARMDWEYEGGELAVFAPADMWRDIGKKDAQNPRNGEVRLDIPKGKDRLFVQTNIADDAMSIPTVFNPEFRDESLHRGLDRIKRQIEFICGCSYGIISDPQSQEKTATEIIAGKQRFYSTIMDIQAATQSALEKLIDIMDDITTRYYLAPQGNYETSFQWDDSIIADRETEFKERLQAQGAGWISAIENRAWWLGVDKESEEAQDVPNGFDEEQHNANA